ncbi:phytanoyl-CoA dioxygenase family protein [Polynucleobacter paneuropaeus]|nr:phytanoyl-CoA dioxygenase family protein [Polynucleobacter paneuropaeus]
MDYKFYSVLTEVDRFLHEYFHDEKVQEKVDLKAAKIALACQLFGVENNDLYNFSTNEYFCEILKISPEDLNLYSRSQSALKKLIFNQDLKFKYLNYLRSKNNCVELLSKGSSQKFNLEFKESGYYAEEGFISQNEAAELRKAVLDYAETEKNNESAHFYGNGKLQRVWNLPLKIKNIDKILYSPTIVTILENYFSRSTFHQKYFLSSFQSNILYSGAESSIWHRDSNIPDPHPEWPIKLNFMIPLDDINESNGATEISLGSHKEFYKLSQAAIASNKKHIFNLKAGSLASWGGQLWHRSTGNISGKPRVVLLMMFSASYMREAAVEELYYSNELNVSNLCNPVLFKKFIGFDHGRRAGFNL